jgi:hypothetical protein
MQNSSGTVSSHVVLDTQTVNKPNRHQKEGLQLEMKNAITIMT